MTKTERLQTIYDSDAALVDTGYIEYRHNKGWFITFTEARHFNDDGEFLARRYREAKAVLRRIVRPTHE